MSLNVEQVKNCIKKIGKHEGDTGSVRVQVALLTERLSELQQHFKSHPHDHHSRRGLLKIVGRRKRLLQYIKGKDIQAYRSLIAELGLRK